MKVYLAGGFNSGWQSTIVKERPEITFLVLNPRSYCLKTPSERIGWNLNAIKECDCVFVYITIDSRRSHALVGEIGYAKALGKKIIFMYRVGFGENFWYNFLFEVADFSCSDLKSGIAALDYIYESNHSNYKGR